MTPLSDQTVYIFQSGGIWEEYQGEGFMMPWHYYWKGGFTLDATGKNLPPVDPFWSFTTELTPDQGTEGGIILDKDEVRKQLSERGWALGRVSAGAAAYRRSCHHPLLKITNPPAPPALATPKARSREAEELVRDLDRILRQ